MRSGWRAMSDERWGITQLSRRGHCEACFMERVSPASHSHDVPGTSQHSDFLCLDGRFLEYGGFGAAASRRISGSGCTSCCDQGSDGLDFQWDAGG